MSLLVNLFQFIFMKSHTELRKAHRSQYYFIYIFLFYSDILILEAEPSQNTKKGIKQLDGFTAMEEKYCEKYYSKYEHKKFVIVYGDSIPELNSKEKDIVIFQLKTNGEMICFDSCPKLIKDVINTLKTNQL